LLKGPKVSPGSLGGFYRKVSVFLKRNRLLTRNALRGVIISSVVPTALKKVRSDIRRLTDCDIYVLGENLRVPIKNRYTRPQQVGQDRLVNAFAAKEKYGYPAVVIDFGTAITFDCISGKGEYLGGVILPGIRISFEALHKKTALLPKVNIYPTGNIIGKNTAESIRAGILFGYGTMCDGLVRKFRKIIGGNVRVIATGGNCSLLKRYTGSIQTADELLTLEGLRLTYEATRP